MKQYLVFISLFIGLNSYSQDFKSALSKNAFLFTFKQNSYVISGDSIFNNRNKKEWIGYQHNLIIKDFVFFQDEINGYLMHNSGGIIYRFDGVNFTRVDNSFEFNTQYQSFPFVYRGSIYNFGGYGLFTFKNIFTYFNESKKETELVYIKTPLNKTPDGRKNMIAQLVGDNLFMGAGIGYNSNKENPYNKADFFGDYWKFNLSTYEWEKLGDGKILSNDQNYAIIYDYNGENLFLTYEKVYGVNIKNNTLNYYENANIDLFKSIKFDPTCSYITYNKFDKGFYFILNKSKLLNKLVFVSADSFLGKPTRSERLYSLNTNSNLYFYLGGLIILSLAVFLLTRKKNKFEKIRSKRNEINSVLTLEENKIFTLIVNSYPNYLPFPEMMNMFETHLNYESRKKRLRNSLNQIEDKIKIVLKSGNRIFIERKNKEDLRIKEIRIR